MANNPTNQDAELSKFFIDSDGSRGLDALEAASLAIPQTARPHSASPLAKALAVETEEGKGRPSTRFAPTARPEPKADGFQADVQPRQQVPRDAWICCQCDVTNPLVGPACWQCKSHRACRRCLSA